MLPSSLAYCFSLWPLEAVKHVNVGLFSHSPFLLMLLLYVLGIGASLADRFHCICMPVGIECSACACAWMHGSRH